jgi:hypothetical protein
MAYSNSFQISSNTSGASTSGTGWATILTVNATESGIFADLLVRNEGAVSGFISFDGGASYDRLTTLTAVVYNGINLPNGAVIAIQRDGSASTDMSGVYVSGRYGQSVD